MKATWLLIGSAALFSAGLFLATSLGSLGTIMLPYLSPLPLFMVGLSMGGKMGGLAGGIAALVVALAGSSLGAVIFFMACALPVSLLCEKATEARPSPNDPSGATLDWYPPGPLSVWLAVAPATVLVVSFVYFLARGEGLEPVVAQQVQQMMEFYRAALDANLPEAPDAALAAPHQLELIEKMLVNIVPAVMAVLWMIFMVLNGAIAQAMLTRVGHNMRPAPEMAEIELPRALIVGFTVCFLLAITLDGSLGYLGSNLCAILAFPLFLSGLGVAHAAARKTRFRFGILFMLYTVLAIARWATPAVIVLGLIDHFANLKARMRGGSTSV